MKNDLVAYIALIQAFVESAITPADFQRWFLSLFKSDNRPFSDEEFKILNYLFSSCDQFCDRPELFDARNISSEQLKRDATSSLEVCSFIDFRTKANSSLVQGLSRLPIASYRESYC